MLKILFICTGNICRSPTAEGVFNKLAIDLGLSDKTHAQSCGIMGWHEGNHPDNRAITAAKKRGVDLAKLQAREISIDDFHKFDILFAMDKGHFNQCQEIAPKGTAQKIKLFLKPVASDFNNSEVPDPYYGGDDGFELVLDMIFAASNHWLIKLMKK